MNEFAARPGISLADRYPPEEMESILQAIQRADEAAFLWVNARADAGPLGVLMWLLSLAGRGWVLVILGWLYLRWRDRTHFARRALALALLVILAGTLGQVVKRTVQRLRPVGAMVSRLDRERQVEETFCIVDSRWRVPFREGAIPRGFGRDHLRVLGGLHTRNSFPSGHALTAFATAVFLCWSLRRRLWVPFAFAVLVSLSRVYVGVHFFSDVIVGAAFGALLGVILSVLLERFLRFRGEPAEALPSQ